MAQIDADSPASPGEITPERKPKRVRTGCLTCRGRHLKCDEGIPVCQNCQKSNRRCERGVRLNFIATQSVRPPYLAPPSDDWRIHFQDKSIDIASYYVGGRAHYLSLQDKDDTTPSTMHHTDSMSMTAFDMGHQSNPQLAGHNFPTDQAFEQPLPTPPPVEVNQTASYPVTVNHYSDEAHLVSPPLMPPYSSHSAAQQPPAFMDNSNEVFYMQVYVEEVAVWMDSMDDEKHFSQLLPFQALHQPVLKNALLACGSRHLVLINPEYTTETAAKYYDAATQMLLRMLQNPNRDTVSCAVVATVLNVYEIMYEKHTSLSRMNHIAGARALIKECGWDGSSTGVGGACFWLNVGMELFSCLFFGWGISWDPETWNVDMNMDLTPDKKHEDWAHMMLCILAKITNFRVLPEPQNHQDQIQRQQLWARHRDECERWNMCTPPTMRPLLVVPPERQAVPKSLFPQIWILGRASIVARLFYHTAMTLLGIVHPQKPSNPSLALDMQDMSLHHARQICGIVAHCKDR